MLQRDDDTIPEAIQGFIGQHIDSVAKLEALLLMFRNPDQEWDAALLARSLYISSNETKQILADLSTDKLVQTSSSGAGFYCYRLTGSELCHLVEQLATTYSTRLLAVTHLIHQRAVPPARSNIQSFADAFKLKNDKEA